jgi:hypothetical protein
MARRAAVRTAPWIVVLVAGSLAMAACSPSGSPTSSFASVASSPEATPSDSVAPTDDAGPFGCTLPINGVGSTVRAQIADVQVSEHDGFDRITFEFVEGIPQFSIDAATPPLTQDPSGLPIEVQGNAFWRIVLHGGTKLSPEGGITYDGPTDFTPGYQKLVELREAGDFEAVSTWYAGLTDEACIRVITQAGPSRLTIDVQH